MLENTPRKHTAHTVGVGSSLAIEPVTARHAPLGQRGIHMEVGQWEMARMVVNIALAASGRAGRGVVGAMLPHEAGIRITEFINMTALLASTKTKRANEAARAVPLGGTTRGLVGLHAIAARTAGHRPATSKSARGRPNSATLK